MSINKFFNSLRFFNYNRKYNNVFKTINRNIFYEIEKNKSYYVCSLCRGSKILECTECKRNITGDVYNKKFIGCDKCINGKIECDFCDQNGLAYYFSVYY